MPTRLVRRAAFAGLIVVGGGSALRAAAPYARALSKTVVGARLYVDGNSPARQQANQWRASRPADASLMERIAQQATATWFGGWNANIRHDVDALVSRASGASSLPVMVAYNTPNRDCGQYSAGDWECCTP